MAPPLSSACGMKGLSPSALRALAPAMHPAPPREFQAFVVDVGEATADASDCAALLRWVDVQSRCKQMLELDVEGLVADGVPLSLANCIQDAAQPAGVQEAAAQLLAAIARQSSAARRQLYSRGKIPLAVGKQRTASKALALACQGVSELCQEQCKGARMEISDAAASDFRCCYDFSFTRGAERLCSISLQGPGRMRSMADVGGMHMTGGRVWAGAIFLVRWLAACGWTRRRVLEIGAGLGFPGIALAKLGHSVHVSDREPVLLDMLEENIASNGVGGNCSVLPLAWESVGEPAVQLQLKEKRFDVVIGADLVYEEAHCAPLVRVLRAALPDGGIALIANGRRHRKHRVTLGNHLRSAGFEVQTRCLPCRGVMQDHFCGVHEPGQEYLMYRVAVPASSP